MYDSTPPEDRILRGDFWVSQEVYGRTLEQHRQEVEGLRGKLAGAATILEWALDLIDLYDARLIAIDGVGRVMTPVHQIGKARARAALKEITK